jgi:endonuclease YncB( thermonuclease family)
MTVQGHATAEPSCHAYLKKAEVVPLNPADIYVVDGDTIKEDRFCALRLRFNDIDAPDRDGHEKCEEEGRLGDKTYERLLALVRAAKTAEYHASGELDKYGRPLGQLILDGNPVGATLANEHLACPSKDGKKENWCAMPFRCSVDKEN